MMRALVAIAVLLSLAAIARAQDGSLALRGLVRREVSYGCGQGWDAHVARSDVTLDVTRGGRARLVVDAHVLDASGGVSMIAGAGPYHAESTRTLRIEWSGRARRDHGALVIALRQLVETAPVSGTTTTVTSRTTEEATLRCTHETRDLLGASRPTTASDPVIAQRAVWVCVFDPRPDEGPLPRPVLDTLTAPFHLDAGAGVTTDASYRGGVGTTPESMHVRIPGWVEPSSRL